MPINAVIAVSNVEGPYGVYESAVMTATAPRKRPASSPASGYTNSIRRVTG